MKSKWVALCFSVLIALGYLLPEPRTVPVENASASDWNAKSFWYEPWGTSGTHKGVDIFALEGTNIISSTNMLVLYSGKIKKGGNVIIGLGPKWRIHYFAHLKDINVDLGLLSYKGEQIGRVGDTGNAKGKQPHLHYSILNIIPAPWRMDGSTQGYKKAFYLNPIEYITELEPNNAI